MKISNVYSISINFGEILRILGIQVVIHFIFAPEPSALDMGKLLLTIEI